MSEVLRVVALVAAGVGGVAGLAGEAAEVAEMAVVVTAAVVVARMAGLAGVAAEMTAAAVVEATMGVGARASSGTAGQLPSRHPRPACRRVLLASRSLSMPPCPLASTYLPGPLPLCLADGLRQHWAALLPAFSPPWSVCRAPPTPHQAAKHGSTRADFRLS